MLTPYKISQKKWSIVVFEIYAIKMIKCLVGISSYFNHFPSIYDPFIIISIVKHWVPWVFTQASNQAQLKENIKALRHWPLCGEFTGD